MAKIQSKTASTTSLRKSIRESASSAEAWFEKRNKLKDRKTYEARGQLGDAGTGSVYVYYDKDGKALYVGETSRTVKSRMHTKTAPHKRAPWWKKWKTMRFVQLPDRMDRLTMEFLLILSYGPTHNKKPQAKDIDSLFPM